ncbi:unnamed protein product, partial [Coregonus sp. 'balchen']
MLFDCRNDALITGLVLWDKEPLKNNVIITDKPFTNFKVITSDSTADKLSILNANASLKSSFLARLFEVAGSTRYTLLYTITKKNIKPCLKTGRGGVALQVNLLPLQVLDSTATKLVRQISVSLEGQSQKMLEDLSELEIRCNDAMKSEPVKYFKETGAKERKRSDNFNILNECMDSIEENINVIDQFLRMITDDYSQRFTKIVTSKSELDIEVFNSK